MVAGSAPHERLARRALSGEAAHVRTAVVFEGLDWQAAGARPGGVPHSVYELLQHMSYWQDWVGAFLDDEEPDLPRHASESWPSSTAPTDRRQWDETVVRFQSGLRALERACRSLSSTRRAPKRVEMLHTLAAHNSYHAGQVVMVRQMLGKWPPPSGSLTW